MKDNNQISKKVLVSLVLAILVLVILVIGVSYQVFLYTNNGTSIFNQILGGDADVFKNGTVTLVYTEGESSVRLENAIPMSDEEGKNLNRPDQLMDFTVSININKSSNVSYQVVADKDPASTIDPKYIKIYLQRGINNPTYEEEIVKPVSYSPIDEENDYGVPVGSMILDEVSTSESITYYYRLRMWLSSEYQLDNQYKTFTIKINVYGKGEKIKDNNKNDSTNNNSINTNTSIE